MSRAIDWGGLLNDWPWLAVLALVAAATLGFVAGQLAARWQDRRQARHARSGLRRLYETVLRALDSATDVCTLLERFQGRCLTADQTEHLERRRSGLAALLSRIVQRQRGVENQAADEPAIVRRLEPFKVHWTTQPAHQVSGLPDRTAFDASLETLVEAGHRSGRCSHLLLVRIDRMGSLTSRCGQAGVNSLIRKLSSVICRTVRDEDLVCQIAPDLLAVLLAGTDPESGQRLARAVRDAVRSHRFRIDEESAEVLLTASFGVAACLPEDRPELVLDRAAHALNTSQRLGRNQLHAHDGVDLVHCALSA